MTTPAKWLAAAVTALLLAPTAIQAQQYPTRNVTIVVPLAAGTGMDTLVRVYAEDLQKALGKPVLVENQPGAALMLAAQNVSRAEPDGHTLVVSTSSPMAINQALYRKITYNAEKDFVPIALYAKSPFVLIVNPSLGIDNMKDFLKKAREQSKPLTYGTSGTGTLLHLAMEILKRDFKFKADHVPYRNSNQIVADVIGGHINAAMSETGASLALIRDGKVKALGITSSTPHPSLPDVKPLAEAAGIPGFEAVSWHVLLAPSATPQPIVERLQKEMARITGSEAFQKRATTIGLIPLKPDTVDGMKKYMQVERERWGKLVTDLGLAGTL
jgi:tripartite-type tricarboxylate transporter receptor subunit TctC